MKHTHRVTASDEDYDPCDSLLLPRAWHDANQSGLPKPVFSGTQDWETLFRQVNLEKQTLVRVGPSCPPRTESEDRKRSGTAFVSLEPLRHTLALMWRRWDGLGFSEDRYSLTYIRSPLPVRSLSVCLLVLLSLPMLACVRTIAAWSEHTENTTHRRSKR